MTPRRSIRRSTAALSFAVALGTLMAAPALSGATIVNDVVKNVNKVVNGVTSGSSGSNSSNPTPQAGVPPTYVPPMHGTNPHGQGTDATLDLNPSPTNPINGNPAGGSPLGDGEDLVVGRSRGEQNADGTYHGHVTAAALFGNELIGANSNPGQTDLGPLGPLQTMLLNAACTSSGGPLSPTALCLGVLTMSSATTSTGSNNSFQTLSVNLGGPTGINAGVAGSHGNINEAGGCQTTHGDSNVANANIGGQITATAINSTSDSSSCNNGTTSQSNSSSAPVILNGMAVAVCTTNSPPAAPNPAPFVPAAPLAQAVCHAGDSSTTGGTQTSAPYGVREGVAAFALGTLAKLTTSASESHSVAPGTPAGPLVTPPNNNNNNNRNNRNNQSERENENDNAASSATTGQGNLAFTGTNVLLIAMLGLGLLGAGVAVREGILGTPPA